MNSTRTFWTCVLRWRFIYIHLNNLVFPSFFLGIKVGWMVLLLIISLHIPMHVNLKSSSHSLAVTRFILITLIITASIHSFTIRYDVMHHMHPSSFIIFITCDDARCTYLPDFCWRKSRKKYVLHTIAQLSMILLTRWLRTWVNLYYCNKFPTQSHNISACSLIQFRFL